jgi:23S rRNA (uracil1939-C5)-methyltransferase
MSEQEREIVVDVERPVARGRMLARHEGRVVFVAGAIPGERVRARVTKTSGQVWFAETTDVIEASADRREPAGDPACGGSTYAHIAYPRQLELKREVIADALRRIGKLTGAPPATMAASAETGYRMRARLHVRNRRAGFFREGTHVWCEAGPTGQLLPETTLAIDTLLRTVDDRIAEIDAVIVAENLAARARVLHLEPKPGARLEDLAGRVTLPDGVTGVSTSVKGRATALSGEPVVTDDLASLAGPMPAGENAALTWHATSFFQANRHLLPALVQRVVDVAVGDRFVDLYAGVGLFACALAARGGRGLAVEGDRSSGADLDANARPWRAQLRVAHGAVEDVVRTPLDPPPDVVILDPPRTGASAEAVAGVLAWRPPRIVYVSCDPPTFARDAARARAAGYTLSTLDGFDLFPNTPHVELVAELTSHRT